MPYVDAEGIVGLVEKSAPGGEGPAFVFVNFMEAHSPYNPPPSAIEALGLRPGRTFERYRSHRELTAAWSRLPESKAADLGLTNIQTVHSGNSDESLVPPLAQTFDVILLLDVLQVIDDRPGLFRDLHAAIKQDGRLVVFPMHVGVAETVRVACRDRLFALHDRQGMLLVFRKH